MPAGDRPLHICLVCMELFGFGSSGGFGRATRMIGRELAKRGHRVTVVTRMSPLSEDRRTDFMLEGMRVRLYSPRRPLSSMAIYRDCAADVYHSQDASLATWLAMRAVPQARHVVTFRAPVSRADMMIDRRSGAADWRRQLMHYLQIDNPLVHRAVRHTPHRYVAAACIIDKVMQHYRLKDAPALLPTPVAIPAGIEKSQRPTVCFVGRWHAIKQPEHFLELARRFPAVDFIAVGGAPELARDRELRERYGSLPNLAMPGIIDQFTSNRLSVILGRSWIIVNTSLREALPTTFVEAAAHRCAILSYLDPDGFASRFGAIAEPGRLAEALTGLIAGDRWRALGEAGYRHVRDLYATDAAIDRHIAAYIR
jgi:glycosyltransferase involved in cell wall biosynthesis